MDSRNKLDSGVGYFKVLLDCTVLIIICQNDGQAKMFPTLF